MALTGVIAAVAAGSLAERLGLAPGDKVRRVNGRKVRDIIELSFVLADEKVVLDVEKADGAAVRYNIKKGYDDNLGLEFESAVFDGIRHCANHCAFCFVDQMPPGLRSSLYIKDDDYRLSFLFGNFITLTNFGPADLARVARLHLSPLYVSVHTTDGKLRQRLMGNARAGEIMAQLRRLAEQGIALHTQVVLCPQWNDGMFLDRTIADLRSLWPQVQSVAVVPVGLTRYRENCPPLTAFTVPAAETVLRQISRWQEQLRREIGTRFVYLADEFYIQAGWDLPAYEAYEGFPQLENGVGLVRSFLQEWAANAPAQRRIYERPRRLTVVCGISAAPFIQSLVASVQEPNLTVQVLPVENCFFGATVTVTGLLTGRDIIAAVTAGDRGDGLILPGVALRPGENIFLDGLTPADVAQAAHRPVRVAHGAAALRSLLADWREQECRDGAWSRYIPAMAKVKPRPPSAWRCGRWGTAGRWRCFSL